MIKKIGIIAILSVLFLPTGINDLYAQSFETGEIGVTLSQWGRVILRTPDLAGDFQIDRASLVVGVSQNKLYNTRRHSTVVDPPVNIVPPTHGDFEIYGSNDSSDPDVPDDSPDVLIKHYVYGWLSESFVLVRTTVENQEASAISAYIALEIIPRVDNAYENEEVEYLGDHHVVNIYKDTHIGFTLLSSEIYTFKAVDYAGGYWNEIDVMYSYISSGDIDPKYEAPNAGAVVYIGQDEVTIQPGEYAEMYFAIGVGSNQNAMLDQIDAAKAEYDAITSIIEHPGTIPDAYSLSQNYPNPFNPATTINFSIPTEGHVNLTIHNVIGQYIARLVDDFLPTGEYSVTFDASQLPSGMYFYTLTAGEFNSTKRMMLVK